MFYYDTSPSQAQLIDYYHRQLLGMMNAGLLVVVALSVAVV